MPFAEQRREGRREVAAGSSDIFTNKLSYCGY